MSSPEEKAKAYKEQIEKRDAIIAENKFKIQLIVDKLKELCPEVEIRKGEWSTDVIYYGVSYKKDKIETTRLYLALTKNYTAENITKRYLTRKQAIEAIEKVLPEAQAKFETCREKYFNLCKENEFSVGFNYEGDTYGIYNEFKYISFHLNDFYFQFEI